MMPLTWSLAQRLAVGDVGAGQRETRQLGQEVVRVVVKAMGDPFVFSSAVGQEALEHPGAELQCIDGYPLVDPVEQRGEVQLRRQPSGMKPKHRIPSRAKCLASVPPDNMYGTVRDSGSAASNAAFISLDQFAVEFRFVRRQFR